MRVDLDALKKARAEAQKEPNEFVFGSKVFTLPFELPLDFLEVLLEAEELIRGNKGALRIEDLPKLRQLAIPLLDGQAEDFFALRPSVEDYVEVFQAIGQMVGGGLGESAASGPSSPSTTKTSRQPSRKSTPRSPRSQNSSSAKSA